jgi:hypothetical protein
VLSRLNHPSRFNQTKKEVIMRTAIKPLSALMMALAAATSQAAPILLGVGEINGSSDLSGLTYTLDPV